MVGNKQFYMSHALECAGYFLCEKRSELYEQYCSGVSQLKNMLSAKSHLQSWALPSLGKGGA